LPGEVIGAEMGDSSHLRQRQIPPRFSIMYAIGRCNNCLTKSSMSNALDEFPKPLPKACSVRVNVTNMKPTVRAVMSTALASHRLLEFPLHGSFLIPELSSLSKNII